jgi:GTP cyclohydrolase I
VPSVGLAPQRQIDHAGVERAARELLRALGADADAEALRDTPRRVADAYAELLTPGAKTVTAALKGLVRDDARTRQEFLALASDERI